MGRSVALNRRAGCKTLQQPGFGLISVVRQDVRSHRLQAAILFTPAAPVVPVTLRALSGPYRRFLSSYASAYAPESPWKSTYARELTGAMRP